MGHVIAAARRLVARDDGQDLLEYGILSVLIAVVAMIGIKTLGQTINVTLWQFIGQNF